MESEVAGVIEAAATGDLGRRIGVADKTGFFRRLAEGVDRMLDANAASIAAVQRLLAALARDYDLADPDPAALAARVEELVAAGLVERA